MTAIDFQHYKENKKIKRIKLETPEEEVGPSSDELLYALELSIPEIIIELQARSEEEESLHNEVSTDVLLAEAIGRLIAYENFLVEYINEQT
tara:strand:+ start:1880 stop:2155 length:276 start_codon:yes stop_codon:yes gene_type:complete